MVRSKQKTPTSPKNTIPFESKNKFGRGGKRRKNIRRKIPPFKNHRYVVTNNLSKPSTTCKLNRYVTHYFKEYKTPLIKHADSRNVLEDASSSDTSRITNLINRFMPQITIHRVQKVNNPFTAAMYELKKEEYKARYRSSNDVRELQLFHSTRQSVVGDIVENNLNWRFVTRCRFGLGNCFSSDADYANCHSNRGNGSDRAFIVCKVLVGNKILGSQGLEIPPDGYDTTTGSRTDEIIYVKYNDNECLPMFVAYYKCIFDRDVKGSKYWTLPPNWFS